MSHLVSVSFNNDGLVRRASGAPADQGSLFGDSALVVVRLVVVLQPRQRDLLSVLQPSEIFYQIIDHTNVFTIQIWLQKFSFFVLKIQNQTVVNIIMLMIICSASYCIHFMYNFIIFVVYICITFTTVYQVRHK